MDFVQRFFLYMTFLCMLGLFAGLIKPWVMLWWEDKQNRKMVLKVYGTSALVSYALYCITLLI